MLCAIQLNQSIYLKKVHNLIKDKRNGNRHIHTQKEEEREREIKHYARQCHTAKISIESETETKN